MKEEYDFSQGQRGPVATSKGKTRITIYLDTDVVEAFKAQAEQAGTGYQTAINQALRDHLADAARAPLTLDDIRRVVHEELAAAV